MDRRATPLAGVALAVAVFLSGAVLLGVEIAASRVLAPTFGSSLYVWGALIGVVLTGLALGYAIGTPWVGWLAALGIGQIGLGFVLLTFGARLIPAAQVGLITLLEVVLGPLWVWLALDETPSTLTLIGGSIVIAAIMLQTREAPAPAPDEEPALPAPH